MPPHADIDRELRQHATSLRSLARDLVRDSHAADDVTQQALHQALAHRDLQPGPLGGWLRRVLENCARQWHRGERRRNAREAKLPAREPQPCPAEALARREALQAVTNAVLQLDEPYQTTIMLRYFEDLPPRTIAQRTSTSVATVKSRLQRGLSLLRMRLDRQSRRNGSDWRPALATTFGVPLAVGEAATFTAWIMGSTDKMLVAAAVVCAGGLCALHWLDEPAPPVSAPVAHAGASDATRAAANAGLAATPTDRESATPEAAPLASWLTHPFEFELEVVVVDATGLPCEGQTIHLAPPRVPSNAAPVTTGPDGRTVVTWQSRLASGEVIVEDSRGMLHRVALHHGHRTRLALPAPRDTSLRFGRAHFVTEEAAPPEAAEFLALTKYMSKLNAVTTTSTDRSMTPGLHPHALFASNAAVFPATEPQTPESIIVGASLEPYRLQLDASLAVKAIDIKIATATRFKAATVSRVPQVTPPAGIRGTVFGEDGRPAAHVPVALLAAGNARWLSSSAQPLQRVETDDEGRFVFDGLTENSFTVRAGGDAAGLGSTVAAVTRGLTPAQIDLRRDSCVRGRIVRSDGKPAAKYRIVWRAESGSWCDETASGDDGSFVLANLPAVPGHVFAWPEDGGALPVVFAKRVLTDSGELLLQHDVEAGHRLLLEPLLPEACKDAAIEIRVWQLESGLGAIVPKPEAGKPWCLDRLPVGWYQVEVRAPGCGFVDLGQHWLDGRTDHDLGRTLLPLPGSVRFVIPEADLPAPQLRAFDVCAVRKDLDVSATREVPLDRNVLLPAGDYVLCYRHRDGLVRFHRFVVRAGAHVTVNAAAPQ